MPTAAEREAERVILEAATNEWMDAAIRWEETLGQLEHTEEHAMLTDMLIRSAAGLLPQLAATLRK